MRQSSRVRVSPRAPRSARRSFAKSAAYSLSPSYAVPDEHGDKYLLLVRVLVGLPCVGERSMDRPPTKPNSTELYDSMVDRPGAAMRIAVLSAGSDNRAYPEFVLRLQDTGS
mmetsp:Transcript_40953/g.101838  ORF Transcript_40953/g.101838 Transcript_40953/m.101838 type:complete len:112 (-) Transcript_40953:260-595(-)